MNLMLYRHGDDCLVVDAGMMFPGEEHLGVDVVIPDFTFLEDCGTIHAVVATHGHDDHIGALPYLLDRHDLPVYSSPFTRALIANRLAEHEVDRRASLRALPEPGAALELGPFTVEPLATTHSIPQSRMVLLRTPVGNVLHTADFKLDPDPPDGDGADFDRLAEIGREGLSPSARTRRTPTDREPRRERTACRPASTSFSPPPTGGSSSRCSPATCTAWRCWSASANGTAAGSRSWVARSNDRSTRASNSVCSGSRRVSACGRTGRWTSRANGR